MEGLETVVRHPATRRGDEVTKPMKIAIVLEHGRIEAIYSVDPEDTEIAVYDIDAIRAGQPPRTSFDFPVHLFKNDVLRELTQAEKVEPEPEAPAPQGEPPAPAVEAERPPTVVLVEDSPQLRRHYTEVLEAMNCRAVVFETGAECLAYLSQHRPDMVIVDIVLPDIDGIALIERVRPLVGPDTPIIALPSVEVAELEVAIRRAGASDVIAKASGIAAIRGRLFQWLRTRCPE